jgi:hypothetical protein
MAHRSSLFGGCRLERKFEASLRRGAATLMQSPQRDRQSQPGEGVRFRPIADINRSRWSKGRPVWVISAREQAADSWRGPVFRPA